MRANCDDALVGQLTLAENQVTRRRAGIVVMPDGSIWSREESGGGYKICREDDGDHSVI
jgi:hypothetical protein